MRLSDLDGLIFLLVHNFYSTHDSCPKLGKPYFYQSNSGMMDVKTFLPDEKNSHYLRRSLLI